MCLDISKNARLMTAKRDIKVWKFMRRLKDATMPDYPEGFTAPFKGVIKNILCIGIAVCKKSELYFCTDEPRLDGKPINDSTGYRYSWVYDECVDAGKTTVDGMPIAMSKETYATPYMSALIIMGREYTSKLNRESSTSIGCGLHSYAKMKDAAENGSCVVECVIPKGSKYYAGWYCGHRSYASDRLRYVAIVKR